MLFHHRILIANLSLMNLRYLWLIVVVLLLFQTIILCLSHCFRMHQSIFRIINNPVRSFSFYLWSFIKEVGLVSLGTARFNLRQSLIATSLLYYLCCWTILWTRVIVVGICMLLWLVHQILLKLDKILCGLRFQWNLWMYIGIMLGPYSNLRLWTVSTICEIFFITFCDYILHRIAIWRYLAHHQQLLLLLAYWLLSFKLLWCQSLYILAIFEIRKISQVIWWELLISRIWLRPSLILHLNNLMLLLIFVHQHLLLLHLILCQSVLGIFSLSVLSSLLF